MCDYGWDGKDLNSDRRGILRGPTPEERAAIGRAADAAILEQVTKRMSALTAVERAAKAHPELPRRELRAAIWDLVRHELVMHANGTVEPRQRPA